VPESTIKGYPDQDGVTNVLQGLNPGAGLILSVPFGTIRYKGRGVFITAGAARRGFVLGVPWHPEFLLFSRCGRWSFRAPVDAARRKRADAI